MSGSYDTKTLQLTTSVGTRPCSKAQDLITHGNQLHSPFLRLPAEIRNRIYHFAFDTATIRPGSVNYDEQDATPYQDAETLLYVCRQIRHEALPFKGSFLHLNIDGLSGGFLKIARELGWDKTHSIQTLTLSKKWDTPLRKMRVRSYTYKCFECAFKFKKLECLVIHGVGKSLLNRIRIIDGTHLMFHNQHLEVRFL
ncbi:hypothetical protein EKO04_008540 [Ascochyta lentis]|uniref:2EXR domain-containing protein n=1 Tax=Ascochyta lentis TaxID=205686 RepID=A0A8H7J269_9PLEO|nr:hypothetical protein EKO04_008540 [Ascochyta lentis]